MFYFYDIFSNVTYCVKQWKIQSWFVCVEAVCVVPVNNFSVMSGPELGLEV